MHKHLKKLGFLISKNLDENEKTDEKVDEKIIKYLYQSEAKKIEKTNRHRHEHEEKNHNGKPSQRRKHRESESANNSDEKTKHRRSRKSKVEEVSEKKQEGEIKHENKKGELAKLIKKYKKSKRNSSNVGSEESQFLLKKEIIKLISKSNDIVPKADYASDNLLKKFFVFDTKKSDQNVISEDHVLKKINRYKSDHTNAIFTPLNEIPGRKTHKKSKNLEEVIEKKSSKSDQSQSETPPKKSRRKKHTSKEVQELPEPSSSKKPHKKRSPIKETTDLETAAKNVQDKTPRKSHNKKKSSAPDGGEFQYMQELVKVLQSLYSTPKQEAVQNLEEIKEPPLSNNAEENVKSVLSNNIEENVKSQKSPTRKKKEQSENRKNKVNPVRHRMCLAKKTFSVVEIPSEQPSVEKRKKSKAFKKYYRYDDVEKEIKSTTYPTHSDSHKLYQEESEASGKSRKEQKTGKVKKEQKLKLQANVSTIVINPEKEKIVTKENDHKVNKFRNSRIPILVETIKKSFSSPRKDTTRENIVQKDVAEDTKARLSNIKEESVKQKSSNNKKSSNTSARKNIDSNKKSAVNKQSSEESKTSSASNASKQSRRNASTTRAKNEKSGKTLVSESENEKTRKSSNNQKRPNKSLESKSDTKIQQTNKCALPKKTFQRSSTKASFSNSTVFGDKSTDSSSKTTSLFLTKTYRDDDKLTRWRKTKMYADTVRRNLLNKSQNKARPPVMEVRYFMVDHCRPLEQRNYIEDNRQRNYIEDNLEQRIYSEDNSFLAIEKPPSETNLQSVEQQEENALKPEENILELDLYRNDLSQPCVQFIDQEKFDELYQLSTDEALNEILKENYDFLKKDFSYVEIKDDSSSTSLSSNEVMLCEKKFDDWYDFKIAESLTTVSCIDKNSELNLLDTTIESGSPTGSEESGYATTKSTSKANFFKRPDIKALLEPTFTNSPLDSYFVEVQVQSSSSSLEIHSIESKCLQTVIECSQKSVQIKLSQEEIPELISLAEEGVKTTEDQKVAEELTVNDQLIPKKRKKLKKRNFFLSCITCISGE